MGIYPTKIYNNDLGVKRREYYEYIKEHKQNVKKCFNKYADILHEFLDCNMDILKDNVEKHDDSKFSFEECENYRQFFFPTILETTDKNKMNIGWLNHIHLNKHHWNHWVIVDSDGITALDMPVEYIAEMLLDWAAMGLKFNNSTKDFYKNNKDKMVLSPNTMLLIDRIIDQF